MSFGWKYCANYHLYRFFECVYKNASHKTEAETKKMMRRSIHSLANLIQLINRTLQINLRFIASLSQKKWLWALDYGMAVQLKRAKLTWIKPNQTKNLIIFYQISDRNEKRVPHFSCSQSRVPPKKAERNRKLFVYKCDKLFYRFLLRSVQLVVWGDTWHIDTQTHTATIPSRAS